MFHTFKKQIIIFILFCMVSGMFTQMLLGQTCREAYHDKNYVTYKSKVTKKAFLLAGAITGLACSVTATVLSAGTLSAVTIPLGVLAITLETAQTGYSSYKLGTIVNLACNDLYLYRVSKDAEQFISGGKKTKRFDDFFSKHFPENQCPLAKFRTAFKLFELNHQKTGLCEIVSTPDSRDKQFFRFLDKKSVVSSLKEQLP